MKETEEKIDGPEKGGRVKQWQQNKCCLCVITKKRASWRSLGPLVPTICPSLPRLCRPGGSYTRASKVRQGPPVPREVSQRRLYSVRYNLAVETRTEGAERVKESVRRC